MTELRENKRWGDSNARADALGPLPESLRTGPRPLFPIPVESTDAYAEACGSMADFVDAAIEDRDDVEQLVGGRLDMTRNNHRNHARFMADLFAVNLPDVLPPVMRWVYVTYKAHGFDYAYFPVELDAWMAAVQRDLDDDTAAPLLAVYRWMASVHDQMTAIAERDAARLAERSDAHLSGLVREVLDALLGGNDGHYLRLSTEAVRTANDLEAFYLGVVQPVMYEIGSLWQRGRISVAQEHLATAIVSRGMASTYQRFSFGPPTRGQALVTAAPGEFHDLGARIVADLLELDGWDVRFLGADTPIMELVDYLRQHPCDLLGVSVTTVFNIRSAGELVRAVRAGGTGTRVLVGGQALRDLEQPADAVGADAWAPDGSGAVRQAARWHQGKQAPHAD